jgi:hypothetical protein
VNFPLSLQISAIDLFLLSSAFPEVDLAPCHRVSDIHIKSISCRRSSFLRSTQMPVPQTTNANFYVPHDY